MSLRHSKRFDWTIVGDIPQLTSLKGEKDEYADLWHDKRAEAIVRSSVLPNTAQSRRFKRESLPIHEHMTPFQFHENA